MKCLLHMSIKILGRFEMQLKWNFMWTELLFTPVLKFQTGMSSLRLSPERTLSNILVILFFLQSGDQQRSLFNTCHLCFHSNLIHFNSCNVFEQQGALIDGCFSLFVTFCVTLCCLSLIIHLTFCLNADISLLLVSSIGNFYDDIIVKSQ